MSNIITNIENLLVESKTFSNQDFLVKNFMKNEELSNRTDSVFIQDQKGNIIFKGDFDSAIKLLEAEKNIITSSHFDFLESDAISLFITVTTEEEEEEKASTKFKIEILFGFYFTYTENLNLELKEDFQYLQEELKSVFSQIKYNHIDDLMYCDFEDITETSNKDLKKLIREYQIRTDYTIITEDMFNAVTSKYEIQSSTFTSKATKHYDLTYKRYLKNSRTFKYQGNTYIHKEQMI
jgi:hypothetical protein